MILTLSPHVQLSSVVPQLCLSMVLSNTKELPTGTRPPTAVTSAMSSVAQPSGAVNPVEYGPERHLSVSL